MFFHFANGGHFPWPSLAGMRIHHAVLGVGEVVRVTRDSFEVKFLHEGEPGRARHFLLDALANGKFSIDAPPELNSSFENFKREFERREIENREQLRIRDEAQQEADRIRQVKLAEQHAAEMDARKEFDQLRTHFGLVGRRDNSPLDRLYPILREMKSTDQLCAADLEWLEEELHFDVLAKYHELRGEIAKAGKFWRKAGFPERALNISNDASQTSNRVILTMRGGAFRDLGDLPAAEQSARRAQELKPGDPYSLKLLGAICIQSGRPEEGERYFEAAGSTPPEADREFRSAIGKAVPANQRSVAEYLLKKDPVRFAWAKAYLGTA